MERAETYIDRYALSNLLSPELIDSIRLIRREPGEHLIRSGDPAEYLLFFVEGRAKVDRKMENGTTLLVRFYRPFDILGDVELFAFDRYIFDVTAITETVCLGVPVALIKRLADKNSALLMKICARLGSKMADFNVTAAINLRYPVENRLASYLLATTGVELRAAAAPTAKTARSTDDLGELADLLGASYRQLARVVRRFREEGILEKRRGRIVVADRAKLEPLARDYYL